MSLSKIGRRLIALENGRKGYEYEVFIKNFILKKYNRCYLWSEVPIEVLIESGIYNSYSQKRKHRIDNFKETLTDCEKSVVNPMIDIGCDVLYHNEKEWVLL
jgi:hypothetical protein